MLPGRGAAHSPSEYDTLRKRVAADVTRSRALNPVNVRQWWSALQEGYKLSNDRKGSDSAADQLGLEQGGFNIFRHFRITEIETAEVPAALQHTWLGHAKSHVSEVYKKLLKQREWRLRWAEEVGLGSRC